MNKDKAYELGCVIAATIEGGITLSLTNKSGNSLRIIAKQMPILKIGVFLGVYYTDWSSNRREFINGNNKIYKRI